MRAVKRIQAFLKERLHRHRHSVTALGGLLLMSLLLRIIVLAQHRDVWFCSDGGTMGLLALRLIRYGKLSIFTPGVAYGGCAGPITAALFMLLSGSPFLALKLTPLFFFALFLLALFALARRIVGPAGALASAALVAFSPMFLTQMTCHLVGPHLETIFLGTLLMWLTLVMTERGTSPGDCHRPARPAWRTWGWFAWGCLAGFSWYTYYLSAVYILPCAAFLTLRLICRRSSIGERSRASDPAFLVSGQGRRGLLSGIAATVAGSLVGSAPYFAFVLKYHLTPPFNMLTPGLFDPLLGLRNLALVGFPMVVGAWSTWSRSSLVPVLSPLVIGVYVAALAWFLLRLVRDRAWRSGRMLLVLHVLVYSLIYVLSTFSYSADHPRYLVGLYSSLPLILGWALSKVWERTRLAAGVILLTVTGVSVYGSLTMNHARFNNTAFAEPTREVIRFLREQHIRHFYANFWIVYRLMFESVVSVQAPPPELASQELVGANYFSIRFERFSEATREVQNAPSPAYIAWAHEAPGFEQSLRRSGRRFRRTTFGSFVVYYDVWPLPSEQAAAVTFLSYIAARAQVVVGASAGRGNSGTTPLPSS